MRMRSSNGYYSFSPYIMARIATTHHEPTSRFLCQSFLRLFPHKPPGQRIRPFPPISQYAGYVLTLLFFVASFLDVVDLALSYQNGRDPAYQKVNVLVVMIGYSTSTIAFLHAGLSGLYTAVSVDRIERCLSVARSTMKSLGVRQEPHRVRWTVAGLVAATCILPAVFVVLDRNFTLIMTVNYAFWTMVRWKFIIHVYTSLSIARIVSIHLILLQYDLCSVVHRCSQVLVASVRVLNNQTPAKPEKYVQQLKELRYQHKLVAELVRTVQATFGGKLVMDVLVGLMEVLVAVCWYCMWMAIPTAGNRYKATRIAMTLLAGLLQLGLVMSQAVKLSQTGEEFEGLLQQLGQNRCQQIAHEHDLSTEEADLYQAFMMNVEQHKLQLTAGYLMELDRR
ncbi:uncharacterized protein LOC129589463 isoform X2 [Paramacrobiotus metropolitanus]|nr:uncharacterized protein LOC129589463 isoform X2 [Paramacrobiotus metropolitanus]